VFTVMSAACALSTSDGMLIAFRALQGMGGALMNPLSLSLIVAAFPKREQPTAIGIWAGISALGLAVGPVVGGLLVDHFSWSSVFWINVPIGALAVAVTLLFVAESRDLTLVRFDLAGTALITGGLFCLVWALVETTSHAWGSAYTIGFLLAAAALIGAFIAWEGKGAVDPMVPLGFFRERAFSISSVMITFVGLGLFGVFYFVTLYFQNVKGYSPTKAGLAALPLTMMIMIVGPLTGQLAKRVAPRLVTGTGMLLVSGGLLGLTRLQVDTSYLTIWPFYVMMGAGIAMAMPTASSNAMAAVEQMKAGVASGVVNASRQVGGALGIAILGAVVASVASNAWGDRIAGLPPAARGAAEQATQAVVGGQGRVLPSALTQPALESFTSGIRTGMWVGAAITLAAALVTFLGLRGAQPARVRAEREEPQTEELMEPVPATLSLDEGGDLS
jgi:EmrB/QacA subfamily drug resistance transporter